MFLSIIIIFRMQLINTLLQSWQRQRISILKLSKAIIVSLKAVISQMDKIILSIQLILIWWSSNIWLLKVKDIVLGGHNHPDSDIKLSSIIQQWLFYILLYHPIRVCLLHSKESQKFLQRFYDLDTLALILICWLYHPHILLTMLLWDPFLGEFFLGKLTKSCEKVHVFMIFITSCKYKSCWSWFKHAVP